MVLHGGPQTMFSNAWGYRWNPQVFSAAGYVSLMINRRGSTGYGQKFTDEITNDWGGKAYVDVMNGVDATVAKYKFVDGTRMAAAGGLVRRLHGGLDCNAHGPLQGHHQPRRHLRQGRDVRHRRTLV